MPNLKDKPRQTAPVPSNYLIMVVDPVTGATKGMPISEFLGSVIAPDTTPPAILSKTAINGTTIRVVFDEVVPNGSIAGWSAKRNGANNPILSVSGVGTATLDFTVQNTMISSDTILISYSAAAGATSDSASNELVSITDSAVTNSIGGGGGGGDVTAPTVVSATVENADPDTIVVVFSESVSGVSATGWSFKKAGVAWTISTVTGSGTTWNFNMTTAAVNGDTLLRSYNSATGATMDAASNELVSFTDSAVTNNVAAASSYLTWTLEGSSLMETYNAAKGIRSQAGSAAQWELKQAISTQSFVSGETVIFILEKIGDDILAFGWDASSSKANNNSTPDWDAYLQFYSNGANIFDGAAQSVTWSDGQWWRFVYSGGNIVASYSNDLGVTWTLLKTWTSVSGTKYIYARTFRSALAGFEEVYKA